MRRCLHDVYRHTTGTPRRIIPPLFLLVITRVSRDVCEESEVHVHTLRSVRLPSLKMTNHVTVEPPFFLLPPPAPYLSVAAVRSASEPGRVDPCPYSKILLLVTISEHRHSAFLSCSSQDTFHACLLGSFLPFFWLRRFAMASNGQSPCMTTLLSRKVRHNLVSFEAK